MTTTDQNIRTLFTTAEAARETIEASRQPNTPEHQDSIRRAIALYEECRTLADQLGMFSRNESLDDISSTDLQYLLIDYRLAGLIQQSQCDNRKAIIQQSNEAYERFLSRLDDYELLSAADQRLYEQYHEAPSTFSTATTKDPAARRDTKIARFKAEKELKRKLEVTSPLLFPYRSHRPLHLILSY
jgi:thiamine monophosphate kinase